MIREITIHTRKRDDWIDLTADVRSAARESGIDEGIVTVFVPHTTAGVTIQENTDPAVRGDLSKAFDRAVPWDGGYEHMEDNAAAHVKSSLVGSSVQVIIRDGDLVLGTWQNIFFCEFDGPRTRRVIIRIG